jgi:charged multivesicular body protein 2A
MSFFSNLFGKSKTPAEMLRERQRVLNRSIRELERERAALQAQEKRIIGDIKKSAKAGQMNAARIMAKDLVRTRQHIDKFYKMKTHLQAVSLRIQTLKSTHAMASAMKGVAQTMGKINAKMDLPAMQKILHDFEKESEVMQMKEEVMADAIDDVMGEEGEEEDAEEVINKVLDEIGLDLAGNLKDAPGKEPVRAKAPAEASASSSQQAEDDLEARLAKLKN